MTATRSLSCNYDTYNNSIIPLCQQIGHFRVLVCSLKNVGINIKKLKGTNHDTREIQPQAVRYRF